MSHDTKASEQELIHRIRAGDQTAFQELFDRYTGLLKGYAERWMPAPLRRRMSAADVVQEAHVVALRRMIDFEYRGEGSLRNWLLRILELKVKEAVRTHMKTARRSTRRELSRGDRPDTAWHPGHGDSPSQGAMASELAEQVRGAMATLPPDYEQVLRLARVHGLTLREIAERMGRSREAVKKLYARALTRFTTELAGQRGKGHDQG